MHPEPDPHEVITQGDEYLRAREGQLEPDGSLNPDAISAEDDAAQTPPMPRKDSASAPPPAPDRTAR